MDKFEASVQLTLKAMELDKIKFMVERSANLPEEEKEKANAFNAKQINDFFHSIYKSI